MANSKNILIYGFGNPGRNDDGLGIQLSEKIEQWAKSIQLTSVSTDSNYQLNIEDAAEIKNKDLVIFVDASVESELEDYKLTAVEPSDKTEFTMHSVSPGFVLHLCKKIYETSPVTYLLHIKGFEWEFKEGLSAKATKNLEKAFDFIKQFIMKELDKKKGS